MFIAIYSFEIIPNKLEDFISAWKDLTELIKTYEGGLGSRLHKKSKTEYIAYAQWLNRETWQNAGNNLPHEAEAIRSTLKSSCAEVKTIQELEVVEDLLE